jgi:hypothetical protein
VNEGADACCAGQSASMTDSCFRPARRRCDLGGKRRRVDLARWPIGGDRDMSVRSMSLRERSTGHCYWWKIGLVCVKFPRGGCSTSRTRSDVGPSFRTARSGLVGCCTSALNSTTRVVWPMKSCAVVRRDLLARIRRTPGSTYRARLRPLVTAVASRHGKAAGAREL